MPNFEIEIDKEDFKKKLNIQDGKTPSTEELISIIKPLIPEPKKEVVIEKTETIREVPNELDTEDIVSKLQGVKREWLSIDAIKGDFNTRIRNIAKTVIGISSLKQLSDVDYSGLSQDANGNYILGSGGGGGSSAFADITGDPYDNTNLTTALNAKQDTITTGTIAQYFRGDLSLATFPTDNTSFTNGAGYLTSSTGANTALSNLSSVAINTSLLLGTSDGGALGSTSKMWSDLFLASGGVINWNNGDLALTHSSNLLTLSGGNMNVVGTLSSDRMGIASLKAVFGERYMTINEFNDTLWRADKRFTVTSTYGLATIANLFKGGFENTYVIPVSTTDVININFANQSGVPANGITYPEGKFYVHFYYTNNNYSAISARTKMNGVWYALSAPTDISTVAGDKVLEFSVSSNNYLTDIELTVTTNGSDQVYITALNYICDRWTAELELPYFDKFALTNSIMGNTRFRTVAKTTSANINADGDWYMGVGGTGGKFGIGTSTPGTYHLNVVGNILGNDITTNSGSVFQSLGVAYLRANGTSAIKIGDSSAQQVELGVGGGAVGVNTTSVVSGTKLQVNAGSGTASSTILKLYGSQTGFSGTNDAGTIYSMTIDACSYQTSIKQSVGFKLEMEKANTWNYADTPTGIKSIINFYASAGTPDSPTLVKFLSGYHDNTVRLPSLDTDATAPTTSGTTKMVITDANGQLSFSSLTLPSSGTLATLAGTETLTNKRITKRVVTTTDDATAVIDVDVTDVYELSAVANATTFSTTGTPTNGQTMLIRFKDAGVAKGLTWDAVFVAIGVTLPTTTVAGKWHYVGVQYNTAATKWHALAVSVEA